MKAEMFRSQYSLSVFIRVHLWFLSEVPLFLRGLRVSVVFLLGALTPIF